jgi:hypothetical protein
MLRRVEEAKRERWLEWWRKWRAVIFVMLATSGVALMLLWRWSVRVDEWAAHSRMVPGAECAERSGEVRNYSVPGTYGDAFAPIVGVMTALALGATVASAFMQREEMEEARKQFTSQASEMKEANDLAVSAQLIEAWRQIGELERQALTILNVRTAQEQKAFSGPDATALTIQQFPKRLGDARLAWRAYWKAAFTERLSKHHHFHSHELNTLATNRKLLEQIESRLLVRANLPRDPADAEA